MRGGFGGGGGRGGWDGQGPDRQRARVRSARAIIPRALGYLRPYWSPTALILGCLIVVSSIGTIPPLITRDILDKALPSGNGGLLNLLILAMVAIPIVSGLIGVAQNYLNTLVSQRIMLDMRNELYQHLQGLSLRFFTSTKTGEIMSRLTADVAGIQSTVTGSLIAIASNFFTVTITLIVIFSLNWKLSLLGIVMLPAFILPTRFVGRVRRQLQMETQQARADLNTHMQETLNVSGFLLMKAFNRERDEAERFQQRNRTLMDLQIRQSLVGRWFFMAMNLFGVVGPALIYWWGGHLVMGGELTVGTIVAFVAYLNRLYGPVGSLATVYVDIQAALALFERVFEYLDTQSDVVEAPDAQPLPPVRGHIEFRHVSFAYVPGRLALRDVSFTVEPGQMAALVGPSGAGKTTITYLLPRLYDPTEGAVLVDGHDLRAVTLDSFRSQMGMVTQETFLFHASIRENLLYGRPDATHEEVVAACRAAQLHDFAVGLPEGYDTLVGERGLRLSGGEKQRLAIARVILKDPRILILDEATSHLDSLAEGLIRRALEPLLRGRTTIAIAHRLSTILQADVILVLDRGRLVEQGTHAELLARDGLYARIYDEQFRPQEEGVGVVSRIGL